jgi:hypothetical protein
VAGIIGARRECTASTISAGSMPCGYLEVVPRSLCPSWRWIQIHGNALARQLDGVRMPELVRREPAADTGLERESSQLATRGRG